MTRARSYALDPPKFLYGLFSCVCCVCAILLDPQSAQPVLHAPPADDKPSAGGEKVPG